MSGDAVRREGATWVSTSTGTRWVAVIGLEVHAQLATRSKLFCPCEASFGAEPNRHTCAVCTGQPGTLPVLNGEALELALRAALALGAGIAAESRFDRKNYFYCDLPRNYQITQYEAPYCSGGGLTLPSGKRVRLERIHLEEDAGKSIHDQGDATLVDLNRAGVPLIESVTHADLDTPEEAVQYLQALREILVYTGASTADMEKGELRCDVNVSVHPAGEPWRTKVEIKNLNSFAHVAAAIEHEVPRQVVGWESGDPELEPCQETRLFDAERGVTRTMRRKEGEADYRYFPDPDLPPVTVSPARLEELRTRLPELAAARRERYQRELGLSAYDAGVLTASRDVADFFEAAARLSGEPKEAANWVSNEVLRCLGDADFEATTIDELPVRPFDLADLIGLVKEGALSSSGARQVLREMLREGGPAGAVVERLGLRQVRDEGQLEAWCAEALAARPEVAEQVRGGNEKAVGALMGLVMKASGGKADPQLARELLLRLIGTES
jgi:aspartyl-tRNA(Asn)/glutamyl-tRNA(Gln) amidotransferase subunit B